MLLLKEVEISLSGRLDKELQKSLFQMKKKADNWVKLVRQYDSCLIGIVRALKKLSS